VIRQLAERFNQAQEIHRDVHPLRKLFVSLSEQVDTSTLTGKMVFTVLGAVAELERSLIAERVRAGLRNAKAKGKRLGRPRVIVDVTSIGSLRSEGRSWAAIGVEVGLEKARRGGRPAADRANSTFRQADFLSGICTTGLRVDFLLHHPYHCSPESPRR
jgi:DNA invertase Pin-like site-specific DNA recombinase